jgi:hypothetical protein
VKQRPARSIGRNPRTHEVVSVGERRVRTSRPVRKCATGSMAAAARARSSVVTGRRRGGRFWLGRWRHCCVGAAPLPHDRVRFH